MDRTLQAHGDARPAQLARGGAKRRRAPSHRRRGRSRIRKNAPGNFIEGAERVDFRLLLAHNPRLAPLGAAAGFDLQLSGHTHAGQFFPWTLAVRLVHAPHVAGLSREGAMQVYVSAGTGTWGPPVRFGTNPELTLLRLMRA